MFKAVVYSISITYDTAVKIILRLLIKNVAVILHCTVCLVCVKLVVHISTNTTLLTTIICEIMYWRIQVNKSVRPATVI